MLMKDFASGNEFPMHTIEQARYSQLLIRKEMHDLLNTQGVEERTDRLTLLRRASRAIIQRWPELAR